MKKAIIPFCILIIVSIQTIKSQNAPVTTIGNEIMTGTTVTVPITVTNFTNINSCNLKITYDQLKVIATSVTIGSGVGGNINTNLSVPGVITLGWYTYPGINLVNNTVFLNLNFQKVSLCTSDLTFIDDGNSCLYYNGNFIPLNDIPYATYYQNGSVSMLVTPIFTQLGPYWSGSYVPVLPGTSNNGITGTWNPATISTANLGTTVYTFTPTTGQCANIVTMPIAVNAPISQFGIAEDIGTTLQAFWPPVSGAAFYGFSYRPSGNPAISWVGTPAYTNMVKVTNLTPGLSYECRIVGYLQSGSPVGSTHTYNFTPQVFSYTKDMDMGTICLMGWNDWSPWATSYSFQYKKKFGGTNWTNINAYDPLAKISTIPGEIYSYQVVVYKGGTYWGTTQLAEFTADSYNSTVVNANGTSVDLVWTDFNLGDPSSWVVDQYIRYRVKNSNSAWLQAYAPGGTNTIHLTGLTPATDYEFQVHVFLPAFWGTSPLGFFNSGGVKELDMHITTNNSINFFPNPFTEKLNIDLFAQKETNIIWNIYDITGKVVLDGSRSITSGYSTLSIKTEILSNGIYTLKVIMNDQIKSFRIMKQ